MSDALTTIPEPAENAPEIAKKAYELTVQSLREKQALSVERSKSYGLEAAERMSKWILDVANGDEIVEMMTPSGTKYSVRGEKYLFDNASNLKAVGSFLDLVGGGKDARTDQLSSAILGRGSQRPQKVIEGEIVSSEIVE